MTKISIPRWMAPILGLFVWLVAIPFAHGVVPWAISLLSHHNGWVDGHPKIWNSLGLIPIVFGIAGLFWILVVGFAHTSALPEKVELDWSPKLLLMSGPYAFSRNPMYVAELALWMGWAIFFGSVPVLLTFVVLCIGVNFIVRREERALERQFGEVYQHYKTRVPRWFGRIQR